MLVMTYSKARQNFASVLDKAKEDGEVLITRADGSEFLITPRTKSGSPFDCVKPCVKLSSADISVALNDIRKESEEKWGKY
mgnify:FL=1